MSAKNKLSNKISIIVPVYNVSEYLKECIDSVIGERNRELIHEIIIVDDGSTDGSGDICDEYAKNYPKLIKVVHQKNAGLGGARNTGIKHATGEYVMFIDSDDLIEPDSLEILNNAIIEHKSDIIIYGFKDLKNGVVTKADMRVVPAANAPFKLKDFPDMINSSPSACNKLFRRNLFVGNDIIFPSKVWYEDIRTTLKLYPHASSMVYIDETPYIYRQRDGSIMNNSNTKRNEEIMWAIDDIVGYYKDIDQYDEYKDYIELLAISQVLIRTSVRVSSIDKRSSLLKDIKLYISKTFPNYKNNPGIKKFSKRLKLVYRMVAANQYDAINAMFTAKNTATKILKRLK